MAAARQQDRAAAAPLRWARLRDRIDTVKPVLSEADAEIARQRLILALRASAPSNSRANIASGGSNHPIDAAIWGRCRIRRAEAGAHETRARPRQALCRAQHRIRGVRRAFGVWIRNRL